MVISAPAHPGCLAVTSLGIESHKIQYDTRSFVDDEAGVRRDCGGCRGLTEEEASPEAGAVSQATAPVDSAEESEDL